MTSVKIKIEVFRNTIVIKSNIIVYAKWHCITLVLHFLTDVQGNMYTYVSHLRYHANDGIP